MSIALQTFASGDTDYISKLNQNVAELTNAINALQTQVGAVGGGTPLSVGMFLDALFNSADALIGPTSYKPTLSVSTLTVAPGGVYLEDSKIVVTSFNDVPLSFLGKPAALYYVAVNTAGQPFILTTQGAGTIYSVYWAGGSFGAITYIAPAFYDTKESSDSRKSLALSNSTSVQLEYPNIDARMEATEAYAVQARKDASSAVTLAYELAASMAPAIRKVGITVGGISGAKAAIQVDFSGTIVGWSVISDAIGNLSVQISKKTSLPPPHAPVIPDITVDKISASAPITLVSSQSASADQNGVSTWTTTHIDMWDTVQFFVASVNTLTQATLYLRILEDLSSPPSIINPLDELDYLDYELKFREGDQ